MYHIIVVLLRSRCRSWYIWRVAMALWFVILLSVPLCSSIVVRINPVIVIKKVRNDTNINGTDLPEGVVKHEIEFQGVNSSTGTFLVDKRYGSNLFWWFFPSERNPSTDPVIVWMQGQPNTSSLYGLFDEHGPYTIDPQNKTIVKREYRWTRRFNVLYLDLCTSCGFSYASHPKGYSLKLEHVCNNLMKALRMFFLTHSRLQKNDLYLSGESMSGKYIFVLAHNILESNPVVPNKLNLKGILVGNGFMDSMQLSQYDENFLQVGIISLKTYDQMYHNLPSIDANILAGDYNKAIMLWKKTYYSAVRDAGYQSMYDLRNANEFWGSRVPEVVTSEEIRLLLRVGNRSFVGPGHSDYFIGEAFKPITSILAEVLNQCKVLFYTGQFDMLVPYMHTATFLDTLNWEGVADFYASTHSPWMINEMLVGYWKSYHNLNHALIRNAGHMVGVSQPEYLYEMLKRFVYDGVGDQ